MKKKKKILTSYGHIQYNCLSYKVFAQVQMQMMPQGIEAQKWGKINCSITTNSL